MKFSSMVSFILSENQYSAGGSLSSKTPRNTANCRALYSGQPILYPPLYIILAIMLIIRQRNSKIYTTTESALFMKNQELAFLKRAGRPKS